MTESTKHTCATEVKQPGKNRRTRTIQESKQTETLTEKHTQAHIGLILCSGALGLGSATPARAVCAKISIAEQVRCDVAEAHWDDAWSATARVVLWCAGSLKVDQVPDHVPCCWPAPEAQAQK